MSVSNPPPPQFGTESKRYRVMVVDDSVTQRMMLVGLLENDPDLEVVGWATNGEEAVRKAAALKPDVMTMDLRMPLMDGLEATRRIMQTSPTRIIMCTSSASRNMQKLIFEAFEAGVLAVMEKPTAGTAGGESGRELLRTIKTMAQVKVIKRWAPDHFGQGAASQPGGSPPAPAQPVAAEPSAVAPTRSLPSLKTMGRRLEIVAIGSSTGGPQTLLGVLSQLPASFSLPVLVVQHIALGFTAGMVDWMRPNLSLPIQVVESDIPLNGPGIFVAPAGQHLVVRGRMLALTGDPAVSGHRPSATVLFQSVARAFGAASVGVLLTGMGDDGAAGLRDIKRGGGVTIAQDEETSVVFGMPAAAIAMGVVDYVIPPATIGAMLIRLEEQGREVQRWT